ncbi:MAG: hypothetical protein WAV95_15990 [Azonexus sp.]
MPRKPISTYVGGKGPRQLVWDAIRKQASGEWTTYQIARASGVTDNTVTTYLQALVKAGIVALVRSVKLSNVASEKWFRLALDEGIEAPRLRRDGTRVTQGLAQEQMWRSLRLLATDMNARELAAHATTDAVPVTESAAEHYLAALNSADYLVITRKGQGLGKAGKGIPERYRLNPARNTGPRPPMVCKLKVVYDPNEAKVVYAPAVTDEDAIYGN